VKMQHPNLVKAADGVKKATDGVKKVGLSLLTQLSDGESGWAARTAELALNQGKPIECLSNYHSTCKGYLLHQ
jgi:hypothetical protein